MIKPKILIGSPVNKTPKILNEFLTSLNEVEKKDIDISYCFIDDNKESESSEMLKSFINNKGIILECEKKDLETSDSDHKWNIEKIDKVADFKNKIIDYFLKKDYTHLWFIDSDLVVHPKTLYALLKSNKDIIANIFWTKWEEKDMPLPQVWQKDFYTLYNAHMLRKATQEDIFKETMEFLNMLKFPGVYKVGGLGACTLIKREVLEKGVNFSPLYNISFWGEDRSFCIRAVAHGYDLFVNTFYPSYHIYRESDINGIEKYKEKYI